MTDKVKGPASYFPAIEGKYGQPISHWQALIRAGRRWEAERILRGQLSTAPGAIAAAFDLADVITEQWTQLETRHQDAIRSELRRLLWRIQGQSLAGSWHDAVHAFQQASAPDMDLILRGLRHASEQWLQLTPEQRTAVRDAVLRLRDTVRRHKELP